MEEESPKLAKPPGRIIVAEDLNINLEILTFFMNELGIREYCDFCTNGQLAIDKVKSLVDNALETGETDRPICLMLLDMEMPQKNGMQVVDEVREYYQLQCLRRELKEPEFVFVTAFKSQHFASYLEKLNITQFYEKPMMQEQLKSIIEQL